MNEFFRDWRARQFDATMKFPLHADYTTQYVYIQHNNNSSNNNNNIFVVKSHTLVGNIVYIFIYIYIYIYVPRYVRLMKFDDKQAAIWRIAKKKIRCTLMSVSLCESTSFLPLRFYFLPNVSSIVSVMRVNSV